MSEVAGDMPWILGALGAIVFFAIFERKAFKHGTRTNTLSHAVYTIGRVWPLSIFIMGMFVGSLATHFFWHWDPNCVSSMKNGFIEQRTIYSAGPLYQAMVRSSPSDYWRPVEIIGNDELSPEARKLLGAP